MINISNFNVYTCYDWTRDCSNASLLTLEGACPINGGRDCRIEIELAEHRNKGVGPVVRIGRDAPMDSFRLPMPLIDKPVDIHSMAMR